MIHHGFLRVAAATPQLRVAHCAFNAEQILALMQEAQQESVAVLVFPELAITGYTCADLFQQATLLQGARAALMVRLTGVTDVVEYEVVG
jgi:NAD+ synthase (glutamine-hydrolysing)